MAEYTGMLCSYFDEGSFDDVEKISSTKTDQLLLFEQTGTQDFLRDGYERSSDELDS